MLGDVVVLEQRGHQRTFTLALPQQRSYGLPRSVRMVFQGATVEEADL